MENALGLHFANDVDLSLFWNALEGVEMDSLAREDGLYDLPQVGPDPLVQVDAVQALYHSDGQEHAAAASPLLPVEESRFDASDDVAPSNMTFQEELELFGGQGAAFNAQNDAFAPPTYPSAAENSRDCDVSEVNISTPHPLGEDALYPLSSGATPYIPDTSRLPWSDSLVAEISSLTQSREYATTYDRTAPSFSHQLPSEVSLAARIQQNALEEGNIAGPSTSSWSAQQQPYHMSGVVPIQQQAAGTDLVWANLQSGRAIQVPRRALIPFNFSQINPLPTPPHEVYREYFNIMPSGPVQAFGIGTNVGFYNQGSGSLVPTVTPDASSQLPTPPRLVRSLPKRTRKTKAPLSNMAGPSRPSVEIPAHRQAVLNVARKHGLFTPDASQTGSGTTTLTSSFSPLSSPDVLTLHQSSNNPFPSPPNSARQSPVDEFPRLAHESRTTELPALITPVDQVPHEVTEAPPPLKRKTIDGGEEPSRPYCPLCNEPFADPKALKRHVHRHTAETHVVCPNVHKCGTRLPPKIFSRADSFRRHYNNPKNVELGCRDAVKQFAGTPYVKKKEGSDDWEDKVLVQHFHFSLPQWKELVQYIQSYQLEPGPSNKRLKQSD